MTDWLIVGWLVLIQIQLWLQGRRIHAHGGLLARIVEGCIALCQEIQDIKDGKSGPQ